MREIDAIARSSFFPTQKPKRYFTSFKELVYIRTEEKGAWPDISVQQPPVSGIGPLVQGIVAAVSEIFMLMDGGIIEVETFSRSRRQLPGDTYFGPIDTN